MAKRSSQEISALTSHLGYWMRMVSNRVSHSFAQKLDSSGVTVAEWVVLRHMYSGDDTTSPSSVAETTGLTRGAISKLIERLLAKGLVHRREADGDRRYQEIELTAKAISLVPKLVKLADENDEYFFSALSKSERKSLGDLLKKIAIHHELTIHPTE